ncbi:DUF4105 domain-containing protein [Luteimonas panaciterrae]|uniref:lipoprotein N-acyltransferase Lnb domain-containing protein n=1 Tax=Luteimonas panaciterrae TaxID=363885 RepID=UPI001CF9B132|nr:DUF4105 domain-containing protein [Luteimonas panaciterrae]
MRPILALLFLCLLLPAAASAAPRIGVMTMEPGTIFFERFGHDALVVDDPARGETISYNYGFFDPGEPGFVGRFVRGVMMYQLVALPLAQDLQYYDETGRGVSIQWLNLSDAEAKQLSAALAVNARPENARYRYDYFTDNCSTRVRDAVDKVLGGALKRQIEGRSHGNTYRGESVRLASPAWWMWLGFDIGLGPAADRPLSVWEESFVPMRLADALREVNGSDGKPLVRSEQRLLPHRIAPEPAEFRLAWWPWLLCGLLIAAVAVWAARRRPRTVAAVALPFWALCTILGVLMGFIWLFTAHRFGWSNHNLLLFNPLCLLLLPGGWRITRGREAGPWFGRWLTAIVVCAVLALFLLWLPVEPQRNAHWLALLLPVHYGLFLSLRRR